MSDVRIQQLMAVHQEVRTAIALLCRGLGGLQAISGANDHYFTPFLTLTSGLERLGKCVFCLYHLEHNGAFPSGRSSLPAGKSGHDLQQLLGWIIENCFTEEYLSLPAAADDLKLLTEEPLLSNLISLLSDFGQGARYHHLNIVLGEPTVSRAPEDIWQNIELELLMRENDWKRLLSEGSVDRVYEIVTKQLVMPLEQLARSLCRLFTLGPLGSEGRRAYGVILPFLTLSDEKLGQTRY